MSASWETTFGSNLLVKNTDGSVASVPTQEHLSGKVVLLYFSAHWCGPCRGFTPALVEFYSKLKEKASFEIVFVSSDRDDSSFNGYYGEMPWAALPFSERDTKAKLSSRFGVQGIPTLIVLNVDGSLITKNGREKVSSDPRGASFPWAPKPLSELIGNDFIGKSGSVEKSAFAGKFIGLYFSAHWCPPCRGFTPKLVEFYNRRIASGKNDFEIIFCSSDKDQKSFQEYYGEMPWLAIPLNDPRIRELSEHFEVEGIPSFVILDSNLEIVNKNARGSVMSDPSGSKFPYYPEPVEDLAEGAESFGFDINSKPSLLIFMENSDDSDQADAKEVLVQFGERLAKAKAKTPEGPEMIFFYSFKPSQLGGRIRELCHLPKVEKATEPKIVIVDIPSNGAFYVSSSDEVSVESVSSFIESFKAGTLERKQLG